MRTIPVTSLTPADILVSPSGDRTRIETLNESATFPGMRVAYTPLGTLYLDADLTVEVENPADPDSAAVIAHSGGLLLALSALEEWAGRTLTESDLARLAAALPHSSVPEAVSVIVKAVTS